MIGSPQFRDLSREVGVVVRSPGAFYPATTEEPNFTAERFAAFMVEVIDDSIASGLIVERRERYFPGPPNAGGGVGPVGELVKFTLDNADFIFGTLGLGATIFPGEAKAVGDKIKSGLMSLRFKAAWNRTVVKHRLLPDTVALPSFLQPNIEALCLLDALSAIKARGTPCVTSWRALAAPAMLDNVRRR